MLDMSALLAIFSTSVWERAADLRSTTRAKAGSGDNSPKMPIADLNNKKIARKRNFQSRAQFEYSRLFFSNPDWGG
jgi:hypothetical protein